MNELFLKTVIADSTNKEDVIYALCQLAEDDYDFSGENGKEYLWEVAENNGYETNLEYVADNIKSTYFTQVISEFLSMWLDNDDFYDTYEWAWHNIGNGKIVIILSYITLIVYYLNAFIFKYCRKYSI